MLRLIIRKLFNFYKNIVLRKKCICGKNIVFSRTSKIELSDGSLKSNIVLGNNILMLGILHSQNGGKIIIGNNTSIRSGTLIGAVEKIYIGENVIISNNVTIMDNNNHPVNPSDRLYLIKSGWSTKFWKWRYSEAKEIYIGDNVWIGQYSRILKGVKIGDNSIVAAGTIVTKEVPSNCIVAGNPGKIVKCNIDKVDSFFND